VTCKGNAQDKIGKVDWQRDVLPKIAQNGDYLTERWNKHRDAILLIAVPLYSFGKLSAASACYQAVIVQEMLNDQTYMGNPITEDQTFAFKSVGMICGIDYCADPKQAYVRFDYAPRLGGRFKAHLGPSTIATEIFLGIRVSHSMQIELVANKRSYSRSNEKAWREVQRLQDLRGTPHVIHLHHRLKHEDAKNTVDGWFELATEGSVSWKKLRHIPERWNLYAHFLDALARVHSQHRVHGNLTERDLLLTREVNSQGQVRYDVRLGGFVFSCRMSSDHPREGLYHKSKYASPESVGASLTLEGWQKVEVWAAAVIALKAFGGLKKVSSKPTLPKTIPQPIGEVIERMRDRDPAMRPTAAQAAEQIRIGAALA
jgi:hypothetical protein